MDRGTWWVTSPWGQKQWDMTECVRACTHTHTHTHTNDRKGIGCKNPDMED